MKKFFNCEKGASAIEYGLLVALIAVAGAVGFQQVGGKVAAKFATVGSCLEATSSATCQ